MVSAYSTAPVKVIPTLVHKGQQISVRSADIMPSEILLVDISGRFIGQSIPRQITYIETGNLLSGVYFVRMKVNGKAVVQKVVVLD